MQVLRSEVRTGLLVLLTMGLAVGVVLYLSSPGLLRPLKPFRVYFDNAAGIKQGATVMLAGRKIGTVSRIQSPVALKDRPAERLDYEAMVEVQVQSDAQIYKENTVSMRSFGLLAELVIDFSPERGTGYDLVNPDGHAKYGKVWFLPYNTNKDDKQEHPTAYTWYDELIISRTKIPDPK